MGSNTAHCGFGELLIFVSALAAGTGCSLFSKVLLSMRSVGREGHEESFQNPLFQTWGMFLGMCASLPMHWLNEAAKKRRGYSPVEPQEIPWSTYYLLAIPSIFDLTATALAMFGLTYITVSIYQMLRGGAIVFVAILKHFALGDKLAPFMWVGVALNVVSIVMVGLTAQGGPASDKNPLIGVGLILCGALVQALQYAFEEKVMSSDVGAPPLLVIAMEGVWGFAICTLILYPACSALGVEDPVDTWIMIKNSRQIQIVFAFYFIAVFLYNLLAVLVTFMLNSVWHAILDNFRPITVWGTDLALFYVFTNSGFGEQWIFPNSYVQLAALAVLLYGTAVYNGSTRLPGFSYPEDTDAVLQASILESPLIVRASPKLASPMLTRSPLLQPHPPNAAIHRRLPNIEEGVQLNLGRRSRASSFGTPSSS